MVTSIQVSEITLQLLKKLKKETKSRDYDEVIKRLIQRRKTMFGAHPEMMEFGGEDEAEFHEI